jgi:hypothetical protein
MKRLIAMAFAVALVGSLSADAKIAAPKAKAACGDFGTSIAFEDTPAKAAEIAKKQEKLVLVLHVSGHFEKPEFT